MAGHFDYGHAYPEVEQLKTEAGYAQRKLLCGPGISVPSTSRCCAFGDFDNDGDGDVVVSTVNDYSRLLRCDTKTGNNWLKVKLIGTKSNRSGIGARLKCVSSPADEKSPHSQIDEVRSSSGYFSQNDLRIHFRLGKAEKVDLLEIRWPSGLVEILRDLNANELIYVREGEGVVKRQQFVKTRGASRSCKIVS